MEKTNSTLSLGSATHAAKRAADIIFVLQNQSRLPYGPLVEQLNAVLMTYGEVNPDIASADLDELKVVSRKLFAVFGETEVAKVAVLLNGLLSEYAHPPRLSAHAETPWHVHVDSDDQAPWAEWFAASSAFALAILMAEKQRPPAGLCSSQSCRRPYIDLGKGGGRKYCSSRCATRERVGIYRKKHQSI